MPLWIFLRHGESTANEARRLAGWGDVPLTARGRAQASDAGLLLGDQPLGQVIVSDLTRARETARLALARWSEATGHTAPPWHLEPALRERHLGSWRGRSIEALRRTGGIERLLGWTSRPPGGESNADLAARAVPRLATLEGAGPHLVVAHGGLIRVLLGLVDDLPLDRIGRFKIANAEPALRDLPPGRWAELAAAHVPSTPQPPGLVLASGSPRRRALLEAAGFSIAAVRPPDVIEQRQPGEAPMAFARRLASQKAAAVDAPGCYVLAADTVVHRGDEVFEKPLDDEDAARMLSVLQGDWHLVTTAWCLRPGEPGAPGRLAHRSARVRFRPLTGPEIAAYVECGEGRDKAGAYGIQGLGATLVDRVAGSYSTVVGLPVADVVAALARVGIRPKAPTET